jgi:signal transduction histidine kinase
MKEMGAAQEGSSAPAGIDSGAGKREVSCVNAISILHYLDGRIGPDKTSEIVGPLGLPLSSLRNRKNWISFSYYNRLLAKLVEATDDERAPFKAAFAAKPRKVKEYVAYTAHTVLWSGSPKAGYALSLGPHFTKRFMGIGSFEILESTSTTMKIALTLKEGYSQTRYNCLAVQGVLSSIPVGMGLPKTDIEESQCAANGFPSCVYHLHWHNRANPVSRYGLPLLGIILALEAFVFRSIFSPIGIVTTLLSFTTLTFLVQSFRFWKSLGLEERVSQERNEHLVNAMRKIDSDYKRLLDTRMRLEERTKYLSIVNEVSSLITGDATVDALLRDTLAVLKEMLGFRKGDFFRHDAATRSYRAVFTAPFAIPEREYILLQQSRTRVPHGSPSLMAFPSFRLWCGPQDDAELFLMPLLSTEACPGFFCFVHHGARSISLIEPLFNNISSQLRIATQRIAAKSVIDNILASIPAFVLIFDRDDFTVKYANRHFIHSFLKEESFGGSERTLVGSPLFSSLSFDSEGVGAIRTISHNLESEGSPPPRETTLGASVYEYSVFAIPQENPRERLAGIIVSDISEAKYFQKNLLINQKLLALGRVASGIAHEINNPLYAVLANAEELADDQSGSAEARKLAAEIIEHVMNVSHVIRDLSHYSKTLRKEDRTDVDLNAVMEESLTLVKYSSNIMEIEIKRDLSPLPTIRAAKGEIQQVFINIFTNAIQAMGGAGTLSISSRLTGDAIKITVSDTGKGIKEEDLPFIFDLFFTTKKQGEGTGQGLYIVKKILALYNGAIRVESRVGTGATFFVEFGARKG